MIQLFILFVALGGGSPTFCRVPYGDLVHKFEFKEGDETRYFFNIEDKENRAWLEVIPVTSSSLDTANKISISREFGKYWKELKANETLLDAILFSEADSIVYKPISYSFWVKANNTYFREIDGQEELALSFDLDIENTSRKTMSRAIDFAEVKDTTYVIKKGKVACFTQFEIVYDMEWKQIDPPLQNIRFIPNLGEMEIYSITHGWLKAEKINNLERKDFLRIKCAD